jgi:hypothetical protein
LADEGRDIGHVIRFGDKGFNYRLGAQFVFGAAGRESDGNVGMAPSDPSGEIDTVHRARQSYVAENGIDRNIGIEDSDRLYRAGGLQYLIPLAAEILGERIADDDVIFDEQERRSTRFLLLPEIH